MNSVCILIRSGAPNDAKLFESGKLSKKDELYKGDAIIFDKAYYSYKNYQLGISTTQEQPYNNFLSNAIID